MTNQFIPLIYFLAGILSVLLISFIFHLKEERELQTEKTNRKTWTKIEKIEMSYQTDKPIDFRTKFKPKSLIYLISNNTIDKLNQDLIKIPDIEIDKGSYDMDYVLTVRLIKRD